jgi:hypothetical protein
MKNYFQVVKTSTKRVILKKNYINNEFSYLIQIIRLLNNQNKLNP